MAPTSAVVAATLPMVISERGGVGGEALGRRGQEFGAAAVELGFQAERAADLTAQGVQLALELGQLGAALGDGGQHFLGEVGKDDGRARRAARP